MTKEAENRQEQLRELLTGGAEPRHAIVLQTMEQLEGVYGKEILSKL